MVPGCAAVIWLVSVLSEAIDVLPIELLRLPMDSEQSGTWGIAVKIVAVPEQVAVPFDRVAVVGGAVAFRPPVTIVSGVPLAIES